MSIDDDHAVLRPIDLVKYPCMKDSLVDLLRQRPDAAAALVVGLGLATALTLGSADIPQAIGLAGWIAMSACMVYSFRRTQGE